VQKLMADAFAMVRLEPIARHEREAPRSDEPYRLVSRDGVAPANEMQSAYEASIARQRARYGPAESTRQVAEFLVQVGDPERWRAWLAEHSASDRQAIAQHLSRKRAAKAKRAQENG
jgi:hypothetical protein